MRKISMLLVVLCFVFCGENPVDTEPAKPSITVHPQPATVTVGQTATFGVVATGNKPFTYKWQKNSTDIPGATDLSYTIPAAVINDSGATYRCIVSNNVGSDTSLSALLTVTTCDLVTDIDGNVYRTVKIGNQVWMAENLRTTKCNDGTSLQHETDGGKWWTCYTPAYCYYNNTSDPIFIKKYGALYNWFAVNTGKLSPPGWHVPTDAEWDTLQNYLIANGYNWDGTTTGNKIAKSMAGKTDWISSDAIGTPGNDMSSNNSSGFSALAGGFRDGGGFLMKSFDGSWWSATEFDDYEALDRFLGYSTEYLQRNYNYKSRGSSVRLVRNAKLFYWDSINCKEYF